VFPLFWYRFQEKEQLIINIVLKPLVEAYKIAKKDERMISYDENTITRDIVWYLKNNTSISSLYQKRTIAIIMRPKEHITIDEICEPDIKFIINTLLWMEIEAKRIYKEHNNWSTLEYLSEEDGIGRFLSGKYSKNEDHGGMIGYIQKGNLSEIISDIKSGLTNCNCKKYSDIDVMDNSMSSVHSRKNNDDIIIYHLFFYFS